MSIGCKTLSIASFSLAAIVSCFSKAAAPPLRIVTFGDSITHGARPSVDATKDASLPPLPRRFLEEVRECVTFSSRLRAALAEMGIRGEVINSGIGRDSSDQALLRLEKDVIAFRPDIVTIMYGTNDSFVDKGRTESRVKIEEYSFNLREIIGRLRTSGITPILMTEPRLGDNNRMNGVGEHPNRRLERYSKVCQTIARETGTLLVDNVAHWSRQREQGVDIGAWTTDQCHPNGRGHREIFETMAPVLVQAIRMRASVHTIGGIFGAVVRSLSELIEVLEQYASQQLPDHSS